MPKIRRTYAGAAVSTTISTGIDSDDLLINLTESTGWASGYFYAVIDPGTASEEKVLISSRSGSSLTVSARGVDGTTAKSHTAGAVIYPVHAAVDSDEANELTSTYAAQGGMVYQGSTTFTQLPIGTAGQVLKVNSGATAPEWGTIGSAALADNAVTEAAIAPNAVTSGKIADGTIVNADINASAAIAYNKLSLNNSIVAGDLTSNSVTTAKIADANVTNAKLDYATVPQITVSGSNPTGGKNGDIWIVV